ncbi:MAG: ABC transporter permease [Deltaproteobacteria bacterium]|nr:ABC transporter permease [Deltaproteobacteria bacterium]
MSIPYAYSLRNLWTRRLTTVLTASGMALVVFVFAAIQMLAAGIRAALVQTGSSENVVVIRKAALTEVQSGLDRLQASIVETSPEVATSADGSPLVAKELVVLVNLTKRGTAKASNVVIRGIASKSPELRPQVKLVAGRMPRPGTAEIAAGASIARRFEGARTGEALRFALREWTVVGIFDAGGSGFDSELWGDADQLMQAFRRPVYSSLLFRLRDPRAFEELKARLEADPRLTVELKPEARFYADQSEMMAKFLGIFGAVLSVIFSVGAVIGAMITMYAAVANRVVEIGTLRALGFQRGAILWAFVLEAFFLGLVGGAAGLGLAALLQFYTLSTMNWQTFSELAFRFTLTPRIAELSLAFSVVMGLLGGLFPAIRAARMNIVEALRTT